MKNMVVKKLGSTRMVVLIGAKNPSDTEWSEAMTLGKALLADVAGDRKRTGALVFTDGGAPSSRQRQLVRELYGAEPPPFSLVTDSLLARGAAAIFKLFWPSTNAVFASAEWEQALRHLSIGSDEHGALRADVKVMDAELGSLAVTKPFLATTTR